MRNKILFKSLKRFPDSFDRHWRGHSQTWHLPWAWNWKFKELILINQFFKVEKFFQLIYCWQATYNLDVAERQPYIFGYRGWFLLSRFIGGSRPSGFHIWCQGIGVPIPEICFSSFMEKVCSSENLAHDIHKIIETCSVASNIIYHREKLLKVIGNIWNQIWLNLND